MKYYTALLTSNGTGYTSNVEMLIKRSKIADRWNYRALIQYSYSFDSRDNKPVFFASNVDWKEAVTWILTNEFEFCKVEFVREVTF